MWGQTGGCFFSFPLFLRAFASWRQWGIPNISPSWWVVSVSIRRIWTRAERFSFGTVTHAPLCYRVINPVLYRWMAPSLQALHVNTPPVSWAIALLALTWQWLIRSTHSATSLFVPLFNALGRQVLHPLQVLLFPAVTYKPQIYTHIYFGFYRCFRLGVCAFPLWCFGKLAISPCFQAGAQAGRLFFT